MYGSETTALPLKFRYIHNRLLPFFRGHSVFFAECFIEFGIIFEAKQQISFADLHVIPDCLSACLQSLFLHILMNWHSNMILKKMGNMIFTDKKFCYHPVQRQFFFQMLFNIVYQSFWQLLFLLNTTLMSFIIYKSGLNEEADRWRTGKPSPLFQNDWNKFPPANEILLSKSY